MAYAERTQPTHEFAPWCRDRVCIQCQRRIAVDGEFIWTLCRDCIDVLVAYFDGRPEINTPDVEFFRQFARDIINRDSPAVQSGVKAT